MTETEDRETPREENGPDGASARRRWLVVGAIALGALFLAFLLVNHAADRVLDRYADQLRREIDRFQKQQEAERRPVFGSAEPGNAARDYAMTALALDGPGAWSDAIDSTLTVPEGLAVAKQNEETRALILDAVGDVPPYLRGADETPEIRRVLKRFGSIVPRIRQGLRRVRCDWRFPLDAGPDAPLPPFPTLRRVGLLFLATGRGESTGAGLRTAIEGWAYARDLARHPTNLGLMAGISLSTQAANLFTLRLAEDPTTTSLEELLEALGRIEPFDGEVAYTGERLMADAGIAILSGRFEGGTPGGPDILTAFMWRGARRVDEQVIKAYRAPLSKLDGPLEAVGRVRTRLWVPISVPTGIARYRTEVAEANIRLEAARMLVAAFLHRQETGAFPEKAADLTPRLGGDLPIDPFSKTGAPLTLRVTRASIVCGARSGTPESDRVLRVNLKQE